MFKVSRCVGGASVVFRPRPYNITTESVKYVGMMDARNRNSQKLQSRKKIDTANQTI